MLTGKTTPIGTVIAEAAPLFFNFNFPFYDETKRAEFEQNFLRHFYMREIGLETIDYFMLRLEDKLNTIMPYYNKLPLMLKILTRFIMRLSTKALPEKETEVLTALTLQKVAGTALLKVKRQAQPKVAPMIATSKATCRRAIWLILTMILICQARERGIQKATVQ